MMTGEAQKNKPTVGAWRRGQWGRDNEAYEHGFNTPDRCDQQMMNRLQVPSEAASLPLLGGVLLEVDSAAPHHRDILVHGQASKFHNGTCHWIPVTTVRRVRTFGGSLVSTGSSDPVCDVGHVLTGGPSNLYTIRKTARTNMDTWTQAQTRTLMPSLRHKQKSWVLPSFCPCGIL
jgi:hypothetical protein